MARRVRIIGKIDYLDRSEYSVVASEEDTFDLPSGLSENPTHDEIIEALGDQLFDLDFQFENDKESIVETKYEYEIIEDISE